MSAVSRVPLSVSQNFLHNPRLVEDLLQKSSIGPQDTVLEIGPGYGIITRALCKRCKQVLAVEKDPYLAAFLRKQCQHIPNLVICTGDFLVYPLPQEPYKIFSNIPFQITSAILKHITGGSHPPEEACLLMQKEAAQVYTGSPVNTLRSVLLQPWFAITVLHSFKRTDFSPRPHVDTVLLRLEKRNPALVNRRENQLFRDFVVYGFTAWHRSVETTLKTLFTYPQLKQIRRRYRLSLDRPPGSLSFFEWLNLFETFKQVGSAEALWKITDSELRLLRQQKKLHKRHRTGCR